MVAVTWCHTARMGLIGTCFEPGGAGIGCCLQVGDELHTTQTLMLELTLADRLGAMESTGMPEASPDRESREPCGSEMER